MPACFRRSWRAQLLWCRWDIFLLLTDEINSPGNLLDWCLIIATHSGVLGYMSKTSTSDQTQAPISLHVFSSMRIKTPTAAGGRGENHYRCSEHRLFRGWITLSTGWISIRWITQKVLLTPIRWIAIYPLESVIHSLNNWLQEIFADCRDQSMKWPRVSPALLILV